MALEESLIIPKYIEKKVVKKTTKKLNHCDVIFDGKQYTILYIPHIDKHKLCIIDFEDKEKVINKSWAIDSNGNIRNNSLATTLQLYIMNNDDNKLIEHINKILIDNRKENLRNVNIKSKHRTRKINLPDDSITIDDIPNYVTYCKPNGNHGDFFEFELANGIIELNNQRYKYKSTKSKEVTLKVKLQQIIDHLKELKSKYKSLETILILDIEDENNKSKLINSYNEIIRLSNYPKKIIDSNIIDYKSEQIKNLDLSDDEKLQLEELNKKNKIKLLKNNKEIIEIIDENVFNIENIILPKYCYYTKAKDKRGDKFTIDRHPKLDTREWSTTASKKITTFEKYKELLQKLKELEK